MEAYPDGNIHALPNKEEKTIVMELLPLFLMQSASVILQSDNGRELWKKLSVSYKRYRRTVKLSMSHQGILKAKES